MTTTSFRGLMVATAAAAILASGARAADAPPAQKLSSAVSKQFVAAQKAAQTQDWATAKTAIDQAAQVPNRTPFDDYQISQFTLMVDFNMKDMAGATTAAQTSADSAAVPDADKVKVYKIATQLSLQQKQNDKAEVYAKKLEGANPTDAESYNTISQAYYFNKDYANAQAAAKKAVSLMVASGKKPDRNTLEVLLAAQVDNKDQAGATETLESLVANYNDPGEWQQLIDVTIGTPGTRDVEYLWLGRLMNVTGAPWSASDASIVGQTASKLTFFGDVQMAKDNGGTGFTDPTANATKDKQSMTQQIAAADKANGQYSAKLAEALYGYGMYPEAEAQARLSMTKPGATDATEAPMVLGQALAAQGKYDDALAAFGQVKGGGPITPRVVKLWVDYVNIKKTPPAQAAAAAPAPAAAAK